MSVGTKITDRQGAQLSQECPPPINDQPMGTNNRMAQCLEMRPLVPIGLGCAGSVRNRQIVSFRCRDLLQWMDVGDQIDPSQNAHPIPWDGKQIVLLP